MKLSLLLVFIFTGNMLRAQSYQSIFGDSLTQWNILYEFIDGGFTDELYTKYDTVIQGLTYKAIGYPGESTPVGLLRENSTHSKLFYRHYNSSDTSAYLLMNLNWKVGDSIISYGVPDFSPGYHTTIDSIYEKDARKHLRTKSLPYSLAFGVNYFEFIEGIGPTFGPIVRPPVLANLLICDFKDSAKVYTYSDTATRCIYSLTGGIEEVKRSVQLTITNISNDFMQVDLNDPHHSTRYFIFNDLGQRISDGILNDGSNQVPLKSFDHGIQYLVAYDQNGILCAKSFLKE